MSTDSFTFIGINSPFISKFCKRFNLSFEKKMSVRIGLLLILCGMLGLIVRGEDVTDEGENSMATKCPSISSEKGTFLKITASSKYLLYAPLDENEVGYTADDAENLCSFNPDLEQGEVIHLSDLKSLENHVKIDVWIGLNQRSQRGHWYHGNGGKIKFQTFVGMEPNNLDGGESCVLLKKRDGYFIMEDSGCSYAPAGVLCQFKKRTPCYTESAEEAAAQKDPDYLELEPLGGGSHFYLSKEQKKWSMARSSCKESGLGLQLVTLDDPDHYEDMTNNIKGIISERHLHPGTQFWTGGEFLSLGPPEPQLIWRMGSEGMQNVTFEDDILVAYEWARATKDTLEPFDQSDSDMKQCLDISFENDASENAAPYWRASNCEIPKYYICEKVDNMISNDTISETGDPEQPSTPEPTVVICNDSSRKPQISFEMSLSEPQTEDYVIKFMLYSIDHDLRSGSVPVKMREEIVWKSDVITVLVEIAKQIISNDYVDHGMLHIARFVNLVYQNAASYENESMNAGLWKSKFIPHLKGCLDSDFTKQPFALKGRGYEVTTLVSREDNVDPEEIRVPEEDADKINGLDQAIDIFWYLFSFSMAACYNHPANNKLAFASDMHVYFVKDFINPMRERWTMNAKLETTTKVDYTYIFGDVDYAINYRNLRRAVSAAYMAYDIEDFLQLVRPLDMTKIYSNQPMPRENGKTGETW